MPPIPGYCARCDRVFDGAGGIHIEGGSSVSVLNSRITCPFCGAPAKLADGKFRERNGKVDLIEGPPLTVEILEKLRDIAESAKAGRTKPDDAIRQAKQLDPVLGTLFERYFNGGLVAVLISLITVYIGILALENSKESLALQRSDSVVSSAFYREATTQLREQTELMRERNNLLEPVAGPNDDQQSIGDGSRGPSNAKSVVKTPAVKGPSKRRKDVNKARRQELIERRRMFPRRKRPS